jgi:hypothetical protein
VKRAEVYALFGEAVQAIAGQYSAALQAKIEDSGLQPAEWGLLAVAQDYEPETVSAARFAERTPYVKASVFEDRLLRMAGWGLFDAVEPETYRVSDKGREVFESIEAVFTSKLDALSAQEVLPAGDMARIAALLRRLVDAALDAPEPADKSRVTRNRGSDKGPDAPALYRILQYLADLNAFRDDCHLAAWGPYGVAGHEWEALTLVWREEAHAAGELAEKLSFRGYDAGDYAGALEALAAKGWLEANTGDAYRMTGEGEKARQEAEDATDRYYYGVWGALDAAELDELGGLLERLRDALSQEAG